MRMHAFGITAAALDPLLGGTFVIFGCGIQGREPISRRLQIRAARHSSFNFRHPAEGRDPGHVDAMVGKTEARCNFWRARCATAPSHAISTSRGHWVLPFVGMTAEGGDGNSSNFHVQENGWSGGCPASGVWGQPQSRPRREFFDACATLPPDSPLSSALLRLQPASTTFSTPSATLK